MNRVFLKKSIFYDEPNKIFFITLHQKKLYFNIRL